MGCISSKFLVAADLDADKVSGPEHVVSLTSTTYGALNLDRNSPPKATTKVFPSPAPFFTPQSKKRVLNDQEPQEIINTWELMKDLTREETPIWSPAMKPPIPQVLLPASSNSPKKQRRRLGLDKENNNPSPKPRSSTTTPSPNRSVLRPLNRKPSNLAAVQVVDKDSSDNVGSRRRSLSPLFDHNKKPPTSLDLLDKYEKRCPKGGDNALVLYSTTLRGIRKTFEDCNKVRSAVEAHDVRVIERDISMDSGFREELRELMMGKEEARPPLLFVKGRLIGGAEEVVKLEEEGVLGLLLEGIEKRVGVECCGGCGGMRFVMCRECNGSCKVLDDEMGKEMVKCGECNENGLVCCQLCCR